MIDPEFNTIRPGSVRPPNVIELLDAELSQHHRRAWASTLAQATLSTRDLDARLDAYVRSLGDCLALLEEFTPSVGITERGENSAGQPPPSVGITQN